MQFKTALVSHLASIITSLFLVHFSSKLSFSFHSKRGYISGLKKEIKVLFL